MSLTSKRYWTVIPGHSISLKCATISPDDPQEKYFSHNVAISARHGYWSFQDLTSGTWSTVHDVSGWAYWKTMSTDGKVLVTFFASEGSLRPNIFCGSCTRRVQNFGHQSGRKSRSPAWDDDVDAAKNKDFASWLWASNCAVFHPQPSSPASSGNQIVEERQPTWDWPCHSHPHRESLWKKGPHSSTTPRDWFQ